MILKHIEAENILKYQRLKITDLPERGQIAVSGLNESGKTAIGETICLALFGRTYSLDSNNLHKVIRWGEYSGYVRVDFAGCDGRTYRIVRKLDNTGKHEAELFLDGDRKPTAHGVNEVAEAIQKVTGFSYQSYIDSFYLAQREIEVPHSKSATVKALIGVDKLETAAAHLKREQTEFTNAAQALEGDIDKTRQAVRDINLDRAKLGRLESQRETVLTAAAEATKSATELANGASAIGKASAAFEQAAAAFAQTSVETNFSQWRGRRQSLDTCLAVASKASKATGMEVGTTALSNTAETMKAFDLGLGEYEKVADLASRYKQQLFHRLQETITPASKASVKDIATRVTDSKFADLRHGATLLLNARTKQRSMYIGSSVFVALLSLCGWLCWGALYAWPDTALAGFLTGILPVSQTARLAIMLTGGIVGTIATAGTIALCFRTMARIKDSQKQLSQINTEEHIARTEFGVIEAIDAATLPKAIEALRGVQNDLVNSAATSFLDSQGAILIKPDHLSDKLDDLKRGSSRAVSSLKQGQDRISQRSAKATAQAEQHRREAATLEQQINEERALWEKSEVLERSLADLESQTKQLRHNIQVRKLSCELIEGGCRRIYSRFEPELRRFVGKILPHLTQERYEHLEIDDDLHVRVFCNKKNDFVSLSEISNGTHRQLMLSVRLALSQALIASSNNTAQFIFFDEPFAFFDEHRMAKAIEVLRRISPQLTQVWLAAQKFDNTSNFDLLLNCNVDGHVLEVSGKPTRRSRSSQSTGATTA